MKRLMIEIIAIVVFAGVAFLAGLEVGHRMGYDTAWSDCKFDAKSHPRLTECNAFWDWYDSDTTIIRKRRSLFQW